MENEMSPQSKGGGSKLLLIILIIIVLAAISAGGWYLFIKKSAEGGACNTNSKCETGLSCANKVCSSGAKGSSCSAKTDCKTDYCVNSKCTEGKVSDACVTYKDCASGLYCKTGACTTPPDYTKYFSKVTISKMKPGSAPSASNPLIVTNTFASSTDAIEVDFTGVKSATVGSYYMEVVNSTTGETGFTTKDRMETSFNGKDSGMGTDLNGLAAGAYDLNIYLKDELVYTTQITVTE